MSYGKQARATEDTELEAAAMEHWIITFRHNV